MQKYAPLFGGDPQRVTVMGESAGGASIIHQITAYGGARGPVPFQRAVVQSPGYALSVDTSRGLNLALDVASRLTGAPVTTAQQLGRLDAATLVQVNRAVVNQSAPGSWTYGPVPDGDYVPDLPSFLVSNIRCSLLPFFGHGFLPIYSRYALFLAGWPAGAPKLAPWTPLLGNC